MLLASVVAASALISGLAQASQRSLQQDETEFYPEIREVPEKLETACVIQKWETLLQEGESCVLKASAVGKYEELQYTFDIPDAVAQKLSMQVIFEPFEGLAELGIFKLGADGSKGEQVQRRSEAVREYDSGNSFIFLPVLRGGQHVIAITSKVTYSAFNLRVDMFPGYQTLSETSETLLRAVKDTCCGDGPAACTGILADIDDPNMKPRICRDSVGNHCGIDGSLIYVDLSRSNMKCSLREVLGPLAAASGGSMVRSFEINGNDITGSLDDPKLLKEIEKWDGLRFLELGNLPELTGNIPANCPAPFNNLEHLGLSHTGVGGPLPSCLMDTVHQLEISNTKVTGPFPPIKPGNNLHYILADQPEGSEGTFKGDMPDFSGSARLHYISFNNQGFTGVAKLPPSLQVARLQHNALTDVELPLNLQRLAYLDLSFNKMAGPVPTLFGRAGNLLTLGLAGNAFTKLPTQWVAGLTTDTQKTARLHHLDVSENKLEGRIPATYGRMRYLRLLKLNDNSLSGDIGEFTEAIPENSVLSVLELQRNNLEGVLFFPALSRLAVFASRRYDKSYDKADPHIFDVSNNKALEGEVDETLLAQYSQQLQAGIDVRVDLRGTSIQCGSEAGDVSGLDSDQLAGIGCGGGSGSKVSAAKAVLVTFLVLLTLGLLAAVALFVLRRRKARAQFSHRDVPGAANQYVAETADDGGLSSYTGMRTHNPSLGEKPKNGAFGFMPQFLKDGTGPMAGLLSKQYSDVSAQQSSAAAYVHSSAAAAGDFKGGNSGRTTNSSNGSAQLPVSGSRLSGTGSAERERRQSSRRSKSSRGGGGAAQRGVELSPALSDVDISSDSHPKRSSRGGKRPGARTVGLDADGSDDDPERGMNITFNAAYDGGQA